ncbi:hypothetical protein H072_7429 [Dactylellina haptotyla CBS 200.50]|uniref:DUF7580 domain-containing protein n=1 Tax=Dactylellina haptotyla (strain CBS 200.50) TaxID=1284197 RepID=S8BHW5_DACHA|nr:hypothetical protein H072_7429 [Dactylellina haptotyla CBS 200.50]
MEVVGVVLGALPILCGAVKGYKETIQIGKRFFGKRKYVERLASSLYGNRGTLIEVVRHLLISSGCDCVSDFEEDPLEYLDDEDVKKRLSEYLGSEAEEVLMKKLADSVKVIQKIAKNIAGLVPDLDGPTDDLPKIIEINRDQKSKQLDLVPRVKVMFGASDIKSATQELEGAMNSLCDYINLVCKNRRMVDEKPSRNSNKLAQGIRRVQTLANNLHLAIGRSWRPGCHPKHGAKLFLDDRLDAVAHNRRNSAASQIAFGLVFESERHGKPAWHETTIKVIETADNQGDSKIISATPGSCRVTLLVPQPLSPQSAITIINDLCGAIEISKCNNQPVSFYLSVTQQVASIGSMPADQHIIPRYFQGDETPLRNLLSSDPTSPHRDCQIPLDLRMLLALRVASNLLQLYQTRWLQKAWSKDEIFFPMAAAKKQPDFSRPFVSVPFEDCGQCQHTQDDVELRTAIMELGILLLEIWHGKTFETQYPHNPTMLRQDQHRRVLAYSWMQDNSYPPPIRYLDAIAYCIFGINHGEARHWEAGDPKLWRALCQNIISPLSKNCECWGYS